MTNSIIDSNDNKIRGRKIVERFLLLSILLNFVNQFSVRK